MHWFMTGAEGSQVADLGAAKGQAGSWDREGARFDSRVGYYRTPNSNTDNSVGGTF